MWMGKLLDASLACKPLGDQATKENKKDKIKDQVTDYDDLLSDFNPDEVPEVTN